MALVVPSPPSQATQDPTATLQAAINEFESVLTTEQKAAFHTQVQNSNQQRLDHSSVIRFVAQIDAENHAKTRKSTSSRLCTFLNATSQFTAIVDTFISARPNTAALVWGGIRFAVLSASNVASYFDKVTKLIMTVGQLCPVYREFSHLYKDSTALQGALCEYYAIIVRLFTRIFKVSQRTVIANFLSPVVSPFESDFAPFQIQLAEAAQMITLQISLAAKTAAQASAKLMELESVENKRHRSFVQRLGLEVRTEHDATRQMRISDSARRNAKTRLYIRDHLSTVNYEIPWKQARRQRLANTAEWFRDHPSFQAWESHPQTASLWCPGRMGVGKTILVSSIIDHLHLSSGPETIISYYFCRSDNSDSLLATNIIGSLASQILNTYIETANEGQLRTLREISRDLNVDDVMKFVLLHIDPSKKFYIIVDALDECDQTQVSVVSQSLARLGAAHTCHIKTLYSGRPELEAQLFQNTRPDFRLLLSRDMVNVDIERYIDEELDDHLLQNKISLVNPEIILKIKDALEDEHDGLFLFARLFIEEISTLSNENAILKALDDPPRKISDLLAKRLDRVRNSHLTSDATKLLKYCGCVKRPLTVDEFGELFSVSTFQTSLDRTAIPQNIDQIIAACYGLIYVEEEESTIQYLHHSVKRHLFSDELNEPAFIETSVDFQLGELCLTYLNFNDFQWRLTKVNAASKMPINPTGIGLASLKDSRGIVNDIARKLLRSRRSKQHFTSTEFSRKIEDILGEGESARLRAAQLAQPYYLLEYAQSYWIWHSVKFKDNSQMWHRFSAYVQGENILARRPWIEENTVQSDGKTEASSSLAWAISHNHAALLWHHVLHKPCHLSDDEKIQVLEWAIALDDRSLTLTILRKWQNSGKLAETGVYYAVVHNREHILGLFIAEEANLDFIPPGKNQSALQVATENGHLNFVEQLLVAGADTNAPVKHFGRTALQAAAGGGHIDVVERLLTAGASVDLLPARDSGRTALQAASEGGYLDIVERLLTAGASVDLPPAEYSGRSALQAASEGGHLKVVERLLTASASVDLPPAEYSGRSALQAASEGGHLKVVERLLAAGASVDLPPARDSGRTALEAAAGGGHLNVLERLLMAGADIHASAGEFGNKALEAAAKKGHLNVVERLLVAGASVDSPSAGKFGRSALQAAAGGGYLDVVERLLMADADVNAPPAEQSGMTALEAAADGGYLDVVERLLMAGASVDLLPTKYHGRTALEAAAGGGHLNVVERLLAAGASVDSPPAVKFRRSALQAAAGGGHLDVVERLLTAGASVDLPPGRDLGRSALEAAAGGGHLNVVERLLTAGASVDLPPGRDFGRTALEAAAGGGHLYVVERLLKAGATDRQRRALRTARNVGHIHVVERLEVARY